VAVSEDDVRHIAALARVGVASERIPALVRELNGILLHMDALQAVDLTAASQSTQRVHGMPLRDDVIGPILLNRSREEFAPNMRDGFFLVPRLDTQGALSSNSDSES
jgi:aspartyl-tRNA(Asn)/glutamyl-tRNA(Gln) amidotransferase subunit C